MPNLPSRTKTSAAKSRSQIDGHPVRNKILLALSRAEGAAFFPKLQFVPLPVRTVLNEAGQTIPFAFFMNSGLASILSLMADGKTVEVGLTGKEGFVGLPLVAGLSTSPTRVIVQVAGSAFRMAAKDLTDALSERPSLAISLRRFSQEMALQASQAAACNRLHEVDQRLARWLLMSQDRLGGAVTPLDGAVIPLTQEFLAHMLGTRRASVTVAAGVLQKAGLITYNRGSVRVKDRARLEAASCECYGIMTRQVKKWRAEAR
jgi:CRP-like cAMP-binding protein